MPWNSVSPSGTISVKANRTTMNQNTTYIEDTMGDDAVGTNAVSTRDHFWNVGSNEDGRHRFINTVGFTVGGTPTDAVIGTGMDGVMYAKTILDRVEWFWRNIDGIYQFIPSFLSGTHAVTGSFTSMVAVPDECYGEIFMFRTVSGRRTGQAGFFKASAGVCESWSYGQRVQGDSTAAYPVRFGNGSDASALNIRVIADAASAGDTWEYRVTYRAI